MTPSKDEVMAALDRAIRSLESWAGTVTEKPEHSSDRAGLQWLREQIKKGPEKVEMLPVALVGDAQIQRECALYALLFREVNNG